MVIHLRRDGPQAGRACGADVLDVAAGVPRNGLPERLSACSHQSRGAMRGLPSPHSRRVLVTVSASLVRREFASRSCSATRAMVPRLAVGIGMFAAMNLTPQFRRRT